MIQLLCRTFVLLLFITFSSVWVSEQFAMMDKEKKYDFYEQSEKNSEENNLENKTKTVFINPIESINCFEYSTFKDKNINSSDLFRAKEYALKNVTPPPKHV